MAIILLTDLIHMEVQQVYLRGKKKNLYIFHMTYILYWIGYAVSSLHIRGINVKSGTAFGVLGKYGYRPEMLHLREFGNKGKNVAA